MNRRDLMHMAGQFTVAACALTLSGASAQASSQSFRDEAISAWAARIRGILARGGLPIIDMQATYIAGRTDVPRMLAHMDELDIAQIAFAAANAPTSEPSLDLHRKHPEYFIPTANSGEFQRWWKKPRQFVTRVGRDLDTGFYFLMGEHEFRHYPSPEQLRAGNTNRDITVDLQGQAGQALFALSEKHGIAFQIHYEIDDSLLPALETMLEHYPGALVIWCHLGMIRYPERAAGYSPDYVASLIERFPGLHFDLATPPADAIYEPSGARQSTLYHPSGRLEENWRAVIEGHPERFLAASDYRPDVAAHYAKTISRQRDLIAELSAQTQALVAYGNAWRLVTGSSWSG